MSAAEWDEAYRAAWASFYSGDHVRTILRRIAANPRGRTGTTLSTLLWFRLMVAFEDVHPLEGGGLRRKSRRDRRFGLKRESRLVFYPRYFAETAAKAWRYAALYRRWRAIHKEVLAAPDRHSYADLATAPPRDDELDTLDLYHATNGGEAALARKRRDDALRDRLTPVETAPAEERSAAE
jgi:hypothetical protein